MPMSPQARMPILSILYRPQRQEAKALCASAWASLTLMERFAYSGRTSNPWKELFVLDGQELPAVGHLIQDGNLKFSPDSTHN